MAVALATCTSSYFPIFICAIFVAMPLPFPSTDWLQVGQSYSSISSNHGEAGDESDQGSKVSKQNLYPLPPKDKAQATKAVLDASRSSRIPLETVAKRHKAVDIIGLEDSSRSADDSIPESKLASASESESEVAESGKKRRRRSYSSDGSPNNTKSGLDRKTKHAKTSELASKLPLSFRGASIGAQY